MDHPLLSDYCADSLFLTTLPLVVNPLSGEHANVSTASVAAFNATQAANDTDRVEMVERL